MLDPSLQPPFSFRKTASHVPDCCRLPLAVDAAALRDEFSPDLWPEGDVKQDKRRCKFYVVGRPEPGTPDEPLPVLDALPQTRRVIESLPGNARRAHFSVLEAGDALAVHVDGPGRLDLFDRTLRLHLPVTTNEACSLFVNGRFYRLKAGEVWQMNNLVLHSAVNAHAHLARIHLIVDVEPSAELLRLVAEADPHSGYEDAAAYRRLHPRASLGSRIRSGVKRRWKRATGSASRHP